MTAILAEVGTGDTVWPMAGDEDPKTEPEVTPNEVGPSAGIDPNVVGGVGLAMGGVIGLGLGLKAEHDAEAQGKPVSWVTKAAIIRGVVGLIGFVIALIIFLSIVSSHSTSPFVGYNNCNVIPKPGPSWSCQGGVWISRVAPN